MCGVSTQTVSRVINNRPDVSPATRSAVEAAIASVGFQPSAVARSLVQRRSQTLGVIAAGLHFFGVAQTLNGIAEASEAAGYALLLKEVDGAGDVDILPVMDFFIGQRVDGIIFAAPDLAGNLADNLPASSPPMVFLKTDPSAGLPTIAIDNDGGARLATEHLIALGRRRIAHVAGPLAWQEARDRRDGWLDALRDAGVEPGPVVAGDWTSASGATAFEQILAIAPDIDGIFAGNDQMALGVLHLAHRRGIAIPDDIAVVGFDGMEEAAQFTPPLTTVVQPLRELGREAVQELLATIDEEPHTGGALRRTLLTKLIIRESAPALAPAAEERAWRAPARRQRSRDAAPALRFGLFLSQANKSLAQVFDDFQMAEDLGFDHAWLVDHLLDTDGPPENPCHEAWTLLAALAERTHRIRLGILVTSNTFRHPQVLLKQAVTVDHISNGRLILGIGTGWHADEHRRYGIRLPEPPERVDRLAESLELMTLLMAQERTTFHGTYYHVDDAPLEPRPIQQPAHPDPDRRAPAAHAAAGRPLRRPVGHLRRHPRSGHGRGRDGPCRSRSASWMRPAPRSGAIRRDPPLHLGHERGAPLRGRVRGLRGAPPAAGLHGLQHRQAGARR